MSDGLPDDDRVRRIEAGVMRRIDRRRQVRRQVVAAAAGTAVVVGGFALLIPAIGLSASSPSGGSAAGSAAEDTGGGSGAASSARASGLVEVRCHPASAAARTVEVDPSALPASALEACEPVVDFQSGASRAPSSTPLTTAASAAPAGVLCRAEDGALHVYLGADATCAAHGMTTAAP